MQNAIKIKKGFFEDQQIQDVTFKMIKDYHPYKQGGGFFLVDGKTADDGEFPAKPIRVKVSDPSDAEEVSSVAKKQKKSTETDEQAMERIKERFEILTQMTEATQEGSVRAMIVSGPPGVGLDKEFLALLVLLLQPLLF